MRQKQIKIRNNNRKIISVNAQSVLSNINELEILCENLKPDRDYNEALIRLDKFLDHTIKLNKLNLCIGDININLKKKSSKEAQANQIFEKHGLIHCMNDYTRITQNTKSQIDVVLSNLPNKVTCEKIQEEMISDHETIQIKINCDINKENTKPQEVLSWKQYNKDDLIENLRKCEWGVFYNANLNDKVEILKTNLSNAVAHMLNNVIIKNDIQPKKWFDDVLINLKREKINMRSMWKYTKTDSDWTKYIKIRNTYNKLIKEKKHNFTRTEIERAGTDQMKMWSCLRKLMPNKTENARDEIIFESGAENNEKKMSNKLMLMEYFIDSIIKINNEISQASDSTSQTTQIKAFRFNHVTIEEIMKATKQQKKKVNKSQLLNSMVWSDSIDYVGHFLQQIINELLENGIFPNRWKLSTITPIPKIKNTSNACEFRPINSMPVDEKIMESIVKEQLVAHLFLCMLCMHPP